MVSLGIQEFVHYIEFFNCYQIAGLRAALARKEEEAEQRSVLGSSDKYKTKAGELSPFPLNHQSTDIMGDKIDCRQPMGNLGNIEVNFIF